MSYTPFTSSETEWATLEIASFPSIDYNSIYSFLIRYPYNCSEQLAARGISLLAIKDVMNEKQKELIDKTIPDILQQLYVRQRPNGGFSYWPGASNDDNWVTSMAGQFMVEASNQGYPVSKGCLQAGPGTRRRPFKITAARRISISMIWSRPTASTPSP